MCNALLPAERCRFHGIVGAGGVQELKTPKDKFHHQIAALDG